MNDTKEIDIVFDDSEDAKEWNTIRDAVLYTLKEIYTYSWRNIVEDVYKAEQSGHFENEDALGWRVGNLEYHPLGFSVAKKNGKWHTLSSHTWYNEKVIECGVKIDVQLMRHNQTTMTVSVTRVHKFKKPKQIKSKFGNYTASYGPTTKTFKYTIIDSMDYLHMESISDYSPIVKLGQKRIRDAMKSISIDWK